MKVRVAYLTTEYPKVSHTFIRRELVALEELGHEVVRLAIRPCATFVDEADRAESRKTFVCLGRSAWRILLDGVVVSASRPLRFLNAAWIAFSMGRMSDRGIARHLVYLLEAAVFLRHLTTTGVRHVHVHFGTNAATVALLVTRLGGPPYSLTIHGPDEFDAPIGGSLGRKVVESRFTVAITSYCVSQIRRWVHPEHWDKLHIVRCTVGSEYFALNEPIAPESKTLVCVGRLSAQKGQMVLLEAFARMLERGVDGFLTIVGDGELRPLLEETIRTRQLETRVRITGWADEVSVRSHIKSARALVLPSFAEGLPVVIMEALALARPVIATWIAGVPELVAHGDNGWLIAPSDVAALSAAMQEALEMPVDRLNEMGATGRARALAAHSTKHEAQKLSALLEGHRG